MRTRSDAFTCTLARVLSRRCRKWVAESKATDTGRNMPRLASGGGGNSSLPPFALPPLPPLPSSDCRARETRHHSAFGPRETESPQPRKCRWSLVTSRIGKPPIRLPLPSFRPGDGRQCHRVRPIEIRPVGTTRRSCELVIREFSPKLFRHSNR